MVRLTATVLFTDLVRSTELRGRVGEAAAEELLRRHERALRDAVEQHGGRVVKGLGDGIMATFGGASDAVSAAVAIQQAIHRMNRARNAPEALSVRVGLSAGDVTFEDDDAHGTPVIEASRLCGVAGGDTILTSEVVRLLSGPTAFDFVTRGSVELRGFRDPVAAWEVRWDPPTMSAIPMPQLLTDIGQVFVGRHADLEALSQLWKEATTGRRRGVFLGGEPGVGKTRLAAELAFRVHEEGATVLAGRCDEDLGVPYQPFVEALRHFVEHSRPADLESQLGRHASELTRLAPELVARVPGLPRPLRSDPESERYRLFNAVSAWLEAASAERPQLLMLDDLQWATKPTLLLLRHVIRTTESTRLLVIGTYRDTELDQDHPLVELLADLRREPEVKRIPVIGLDQSAVLAFVAQTSGQEPDDDAVTLATAIYLETEGNPFFVREVLRHLVETGAMVRRGEVFSARLPIEELGIPEGVREVVGKRLGRLSADANRVLRTAAVVGPEFEPQLVRAAGDFDEEQLISALEEAIAARLVLEADNGRYRFAHALVRDALYAGLTAVRRVAVHRRVAEGIETLHEAALDDYLPALAHHWSRASAPATQLEKALSYARRAGDRALAQLAHDEAARYYRSAVELLDLAQVPPDDFRRIRLLIALGEAQRRAGDQAHRQTLLDAARLADASGDAEGLADAALANSAGVKPATFAGIDEERVHALESALRRIGPGDSATRARLLAALGLELYRVEDGRREALSDESLAMARRLGDPATLANVLMGRSYAVGAPERLASRLDETAELLELTEQLRDPVLRFRAAWLRFRAAMEAGDVLELDRCLDIEIPLAADLGQPWLRWALGAQRFGRLLLAGCLSEAEQTAADAWAEGQAAEPNDALIYYACQTFYLEIQRGEMRRSTEILEQASAIWGGWPQFEQYLAVAHLEAGDEGEARHRWEVLLEQQGPPPRHNLWLTHECLSAVIASRLGDKGRSAGLYVELEPFADHFPVHAGGASIGATSHFLGLLATTLARFDDAEGHFARAVEVHRQIGAPIWLAHSQLEWAHLLMARRGQGDAERARELLGQALAAARERNLAKLEGRAAALLE